MRSTRAVSYCQLWPLWLYHIFPDYLRNGTIFGGGGVIIEHKMCFDFLYKFIRRHFSFYEELSEICS